MPLPPLLYETVWRGLAAVAFGFSLRHGARRVSCLPSSSKTPLSCPAAVSRGRTRPKQQRSAAQQLLRALQHECPRAAQGGLEQGLRVAEWGRAQVPLLPDSQALRAGPGSQSSAHSTSVERLLYARPCAGRRGGCPGFLPTPDPLRLCTWLLARIADWSPR